MIYYISEAQELSECSVQLYDWALPTLRGYAYIIVNVIIVY